MIGRTLSAHPKNLPRMHKPLKPILELREVSALNNANVLYLRGLSLDVGSGEILGIAGVDGNGQSEVAEVISGLRKVIRGRIIIDGREVTNQSPHNIRESGLAYIPEIWSSIGITLNLTQII
jgi:simple sugar transport system ATP-binding protein